MKVRELIKKLADRNMDAEVMVSTGDTYNDVSDFCLTWGGPHSTDSEKDHRDEEFVYIESSEDNRENAALPDMLVGERIRDSIAMVLTDVDEQVLLNRALTLKAALDWLEKQGEQKTADNVNPKFHPGDWIIHNTANFVFKIINVGSNGYEVVNRENYKKTISFDNEDNYHLWTTQDAKNGDVLVDEDNNIGLYLEKKSDLYWHSCIYLGCDNYLRSVGGYHKHKNTKPATKEQRDLFFWKMKEAGKENEYETDGLEKN